MTIRQVPTGQRVCLKRLTGYYTTSIVIENNAGAVYVERCQAGGQGGRLIVRNSSAVTLNEVYAVEVRIESSHVAYNRGIAGIDFNQDPVLWVARSVVTFGNSIVRGSRANYSMALCQVLLPPGEAIAGYDSVLIMGAGTSIQGGRLGVSGGSCPPISLEANAIRGSNIRVIRDPATTLGTLSGTVAVQTASCPTLDGIVGDEIAGRMDFDLQAAPGSAAAMIASLPAEPAYGPLGIRWADLGAYLVADTAVVDGSGHRKVSFGFPKAFPIGRPMLFQSLVLDQGSIMWSTPAVIIRN